MFNNAGLSLADIAAVTNNRNNDGMWGDGGGWWAWILIFALFGWGGNGFGFGSNGNQCCNNNQFVEAAVQRGFDNQTVVNKLDGITNGICNLGYDQLAQMNGIQNAVQQTGWNLQQTMNQNAIAAMQQAWAAQQQASDCCCENRVGQMNIMNSMERISCSTNNNMNEGFQKLMWSNQQGFRDISDQINAGFANLEKMQLMQENANLRQQVNDSNLDRALQSQASWIVGQVAPRSQPAFLTCNPDTGMVFPQAALDQWQTYRCQHPCCPPRQDNCCGNQNF